MNNKAKLVVDGIVSGTKIFLIFLALGFAMEIFFSDAEISMLFNSNMYFYLLKNPLFFGVYTVILLFAIVNRFAKAKEDNRSLEDNSKTN